MGNEVSRYEALAPSHEEIREVYSKFGDYFDLVAENDRTTALAIGYSVRITSLVFEFLLTLHALHEEQFKSLAEDFRAYVEDEVEERTDFQSDEIRRRFEGRFEESKRRLDRHLEMIQSLQDRIVPGKDLSDEDRKE